VVRIDALAEKYPGGIKAFVERYKPRCNNNLAVFCAMGGNDLEPLFQDLEQHGFDRSDAVFFDAARYLLGADATGDYHDIGFQTPWLKGRCSSEGFYVWYEEHSSDTGNGTGTGLVLKLYHHDGGGSFNRLKRKKWNWQFLAGGLVTGSMISSWYQTFNIGHTEDLRFWALQDHSLFRKIVAIAEVETFDPKYVPEIAVQLLRYYDNGGDFYLGQMTELGDIPLPINQ
jgi:hypothetical protein